MKHKFLPILLIITLGLATSLSIFCIPIHAQDNYSGIGSERDTYAKNATAAQQSYNIMRAYADYQKDPTSQSRADTLNRALRSADMDANFTANTPPEDVREAVNDHFDRVTAQPGQQMTEIPDESTALTNALETEEQRVERANNEYDAVQGDWNSQQIADQYSTANITDRALTEKDVGNQNMADTVRQQQDLDRMQKLGCISKYRSNYTGTKENESQPSGLCEDLIKEYNQRCNEGRVVCEEIENSTLPIPLEKFESAKETAIEALQDAESFMHSIVKDEMLGQNIKVSEILRYKTDEALMKEGELTEEDYLQTSYVGKGIVYFISRIVDSLVIAVGSLAVVALIIGGYLLMSSGMDEQKRENGKEVIKYTIIGLIIVFSSYAIVSLIIGLFFY